MKKIDRENEIKEAKSLISSLNNLIINRDDFQQKSELRDISDVLVQVNKTIDNNKYPERLLSKLTTFIYSMGPAGKIYFQKDQEQLIDKIAVIAQKSGNTGLYYSSFNTKSDFFNRL